MRAVSLLVLLCCSLLEGQSVSVKDITLSHYEGKDNQIQAEDPRTERPATTSTQQSCQPDIHSALREMSAMLAELKVEQRHTTTAVNSMESRLRASESQVEELKRKNEEQSQINQAQTVNQSTMEARFGTELEELKRKSDEELKDLKTSFKVTENQVESLKQENQAQMVNQSAMETRFGTELEELKRKNDEELKDLKTSFKVTENQVESLKVENQERKVAFSASLLVDGDGHTGPYSTLFPLVYKNVFTNIGKAYNPATGIFTAPVRGVYQFRFHIHGYSGRVVAVQLHKNGHQVAGTYAYQDQHRVSSSNGVSLLLEVGDVVCIKLHPNSWIYDSDFHHCTFSGHMLFSI
ncbi:interaptin-like isoform X1 [Colossoma macropomum]|uniref:interaptin-like isoform X1 n=1 Tax=Colossoma macropomum TaxID=42526 RepID=UPI0018652E72|nr:interaptin-like isoform X1 [Colossoma macropomum]